MISGFCTNSSCEYLCKGSRGALCGSPCGACEIHGSPCESSGGSSCRESRENSCRSLCEICEFSRGLIAIERRGTLELDMVKAYNFGKKFMVRRNVSVGIKSIRGEHLF